MELDGFDPLLCLALVEAFEVELFLGVAPGFEAWIGKRENGST